MRRLSEVRFSLKQGSKTCLMVSLCAIRSSRGMEQVIRWGLWTLNLAVIRYLVLHVQHLDSYVDPATDLKDLMVRLETLTDIAVNDIDTLKENL